MAQRILDLESELARSRAEISKGIPRNTEFSKGNVEDGAAEEKDWILEASHGWLGEFTLDSPKYRDDVCLQVNVFESKNHHF